jgi:hypothetical protein
MNQPSLFPDDLPPHARHRERDRRPALARAADPETAHAAGRRVADSGLVAGQVERVAAAVRAHPGKTSLELAEAAGMDRFVVARRLSLAKRAGLVKRGAKRMQKNGFSAEEWFPAEGER